MQSKQSFLASKQIKIFLKRYVISTGANPNSLEIISQMYSSDGFLIVVATYCRLMNAIDYMKNTATTTASNNNYY
uniref:Uncharacterized protein n=1 Tax=Anguilla anguilla TaxID=7936 RepID=A0A0E9WIU0_ANGAN